MNEPSLFDLDEVTPKRRPRRGDRVAPGSGRVVRVLPDVPTIDRSFDYAVPDDWTVVDDGGAHRGGPRELGLGTRVRISFSGRRVGGWVTDVDVVGEPERGLLPIAKITGAGPAPEMFDLARWAAHRWVGRTNTFLRAASPEGAIGGLPRRAGVGRPPPPASASSDDGLINGAFTEPLSVIQWPPGHDVWPIVAAAMRRGNALVITPSQTLARQLANRARTDRATVATLPGGWALAASGATVIGTRSAAWAPMTDLAAVIVIDEHDHMLQEERSPTWHAREVAIERARRSGVPCVLVSAVPSLAARQLAPVRRPSRSRERNGWPIVDVVDRRSNDDGPGLFSRTFVDRLRGDQRVVCVLNRTGRARLLACSSCGDLVQCDACSAAMAQTEEGRLDCGRCGHQRPAVCLRCGPARLKLVRIGVSRAREELEALVREPVAELTASSAPGSASDARVVIGTTAVLHQVDRAQLVAFLDFDQELLSTRYRAIEQAQALLARGARLLGGRGDGRLLVQTRVPDHEVIRSVLTADADVVADAESARRRALGYPPFTGLALVSGAAATRFIRELGEPADVEIFEDDDGRWLVRAPTWDRLATVLGEVKRPPGRLRIDIDPQSA